MLNLPELPIERIPATRTARNGEQLKQFVINDRAAWREAIEKWVPETAQAGHQEILRAGNPQLFTSSIDGTTGKSGTSRRGFVPGPIENAHTAARVLYSGQELAETANKLRAVLGATIRKRFPKSRLQRLARDWVWYLIRDGINERGTPQYLGGMVGVEIGLYDLLYLVPEGPEPAKYAYMANWNAKHNNNRPLTKRQVRLKLSGPRKNASKAPRDRREGFMAEAARRMRALHLPGVKVKAVFVETGLTSGFSKSPRMPAIRLCFDKYMRRAVHT